MGEKSASSGVLFCFYIQHHHQKTFVCLSTTALTSVKSTGTYYNNFMVTEVVQACGQETELQIRQSLPGLTLTSALNSLGLLLHY